MIYPQYSYTSPQYYPQIPQQLQNMYGTGQQPSADAEHVHGGTTAAAGSAADQERRHRVGGERG